MKLTWKEVLLPNDNLGYALIKETGKPYEVDRYTGEVRVHKEPNVNSPFKCYRNIIISSDEGKIYLSSKFFPDNNFRRILAVKLNILENDEITEETIKRLTSLDVNNLGIEDLTGLENFVNLRTLNCSNNYISELDISKNTNLFELNVDNNPLRILTNSIDNDKLYYISVANTIIENIQTFINNLPTWPESEEEDPLFGCTDGLLNQEQVDILENKGWLVLIEEPIEISSYYYLELNNNNYHINAQLMGGLDISDSNAVFITIISLNETDCIDADSEPVDLTTSLDDLKNGFDFSEYITQGKSYGIYNVHRDEEILEYELIFEYPCEEVPIEEECGYGLNLTNNLLSIGSSGPCDLTDEITIWFERYDPDSDEWIFGDLIETTFTMEELEDGVDMSNEFGGLLYDVYDSQGNSSIFNEIPGSRHNQPAADPEEPIEPIEPNEPQCISEGSITINNGYLEVELIICDEEYTEAPETFNIYLQEFNDGAELYFDPEDIQAGTTMITYTNGESLNRKALPQNHQGFNWYVTSVDPNPIQGAGWIYDTPMPLQGEEEE